MKRAASILLLIIMIMTLFAACGTEKTELQKTADQIKVGMGWGEAIETMGEDPTGYLYDVFDTLVYENEEGEALLIFCKEVEREGKASLLNEVEKIKYFDAESYVEYKKDDDNPNALFKKEDWWANAYSPWTESSEEEVLESEYDKLLND